MRRIPASARIVIFRREMRRVMKSVETLTPWIVTWTAHVSAADRLTAARISMQQILSAAHVKLKVLSLEDHSLQCAVTVPGPAKPHEVVPRGPEPHRLWIVSWTSTQIAAHAEQAGGFALNTLFEDEGIDLTVADRFLSDARSVNVKRRRKEATLWLR